MSSPRSRKRKSFSRKRKRLSIWRVIGRVLRLGCILALLGGVIIGGGIVYFSQNLPDIRDIYKTFRRPSLTLYDQNGILLATYGDTYGEMVAVENLPNHVSEALLAVEDKRFYDHFGIDIIGILRAFWVNYQAGGVVQGGSTLTQQLAKNLLQAHQLYSPHDRSFKRKIQEAILAVILESKLTKKQILTLYLNRVYFGGGAFGVDAAAMRYFGRHAKEISLYEAAVLMGLLKAPSRYSPAQNPERSDGRARQVLLKMVEAGFIASDTMETALAMATPPPEVSNASSVRYFTDWVVDTLSQYVSLDQDLDVHTTLDLSLQEIAEEKAKTVMETTGKKWNAEQLAFVTMTPDGAVKAMLGGTDYRLTKFNRATQALRQPGSVFKFFTFLAAVESGMKPEIMIDDTPFTIGKWKPKNYRYQAQGVVTLKTAFAKSVNAVAIRLAVQLGVPRLIETARKLGITTNIPRNLSIALGTGEVSLLELTGAFAVVVNQGLRVIPHGVAKIKDKQGHVLFRWEPSREVLLQPEAVEKMRYLMRAVIEEGTGRSARLEGRPVIGKTGTSQEYRDTWFVGGTAELVTGVWAGRDSDKPMTRVAGGSVPTHLFKASMAAILVNTPVHDFMPPPLLMEETADNPGESMLETLLAEDEKNPSTPPQKPDPRQAFGGWEHPSPQTPDESGSEAETDVPHGTLDALLEASNQEE